MTGRRSNATRYVLHHKEGTTWARGWMKGRAATGYWEWFRKEGTKLRSGYFENGKQVGRWTTYDRRGRTYKVTVLGPKKKVKSKGVSGGVDAYLHSLEMEKRDALEKLRRAIRAAAPGAEECISYQLPAFRLDGKLLVCFGAAANHCAFYPGSVIGSLGRELKRYRTSKGTIRFKPDGPLPPALVRKIVKARIAQIAGRRS